MAVKLSIAMPSHRNYRDSYDSIYAAEQWCANTPKRNIFLSDNSGDDSKKRAYGRDVPPCSMMDNFLHAFNRTDGNYVLLMQDDDKIFSLSDGNINVTKDVVGIIPHIQAFTPDMGVIKAYSIPNPHETATQRVQEYAYNNGGSNLALFGFWRRDVLGSLLRLWAQHPLQPAYGDWAIVYALMSSGKVMRDPSTVYFKNISNWAGTAEEVSEEKGKLFRASGVEHMLPYITLLQAIDSFIFIMRKDSPIPYLERYGAATTCLSPYTFEQVMAVLEENNLGDQYREFFKHAIGEEWPCRP